MAQTVVRVSEGSLHEFVREVFVRMGMPVDDATVEADSLLWANLRGVDSHGVLRIPWYVSNVDRGIMNPKPRIQVVKETPAAIVVDSDRAFGPVVTIFALKKVMEKAKKTGIGWGFLNNHTHQGALGHYAQMVSKNEMAGIVFACSPPAMAPFGARAAGLSNGPISIAVPAKKHRELLLDMAASVVARGKVWLALDKGVPMPEGWALDKNGDPTTDPNQAAIFLPVGGPKGSGLALMFECICSVIIGNPLLAPHLMSGNSEPKSSETAETKGSHPDKMARHVQTSVVAAIDIEQFTDIESYKQDIDNLIDGIKGLPKADGFSEVLVPGEPEARTLAERSKNGIPLPERTVRNLQGVAERFGVRLPSGL